MAQDYLEERETAVVGLHHKDGGAVGGGETGRAGRCGLGRSRRRQHADARNGAPEGGAAALLAVGAHRAARRAGYGLADGQPQPSALAEVVELGKALEQVRLLAARNARAGVFDAHNQVVPVDGAAQADVPRAGVLDGVGQIVGHNLHQAAAVEVDHAGVVGIVDHKLDARNGGGYALAEGLGHLAYHVRDVEVGIFELDHSGLDLREVEDVAHQTQQQLVVGVDYLDEFGALGRVVGGLEQLREAHYGVERRAYLVAHVGQESRLEAVGLLGALNLLAQPLLVFDVHRIVLTHTDIVEHVAVAVVIVGDAVDVAVLVFVAGKDVEPHLHLAFGVDAVAQHLDEAEPLGRRGVVGVDEVHVFVDALAGAQAAVDYLVIDGENLAPVVEVPHHDARGLERELELVDRVDDLLVGLHQLGDVLLHADVSGQASVDVAHGADHHFPIAVALAVELYSQYVALGHAAAGKDVVVEAADGGAVGRVCARDDVVDVGAAAGVEALVANVDEEPRRGVEHPDPELAHLHGQLELEVDLLHHVLPLDDVGDVAPDVDYLDHAAVDVALRGKARFEIVAPAAHRARPEGDALALGAAGLEAFDGVEHVLALLGHHERHGLGERHGREVGVVVGPVDAADKVGVHIVAEDADAAQLDGHLELRAHHGVAQGAGALVGDVLEGAEDGDHGALLELRYGVHLVVAVGAVGLDVAQHVGVDLRLAVEHGAQRGEVSLAVVGVDKGQILVEGAQGDELGIAVHSVEHLFGGAVAPGRYVPRLEHEVELDLLLHQHPACPDVFGAVEAGDDDAGHAPARVAQHLHREVEIVEPGVVGREVVDFGEVVEGVAGARVDAQQTLVGADVALVVDYAGTAEDGIVEDGYFPAGGLAQVREHEQGRLVVRRQRAVSVV